jgi:hypothetical protein
MTSADWLLSILLGGLVGLVGQAVRVIVGLKKVQETASAAGTRFADEFQGSQLLVSLLIGFTAGALAALTLGSGPANPTRQDMMVLLGAGYAGTDFIEGLISKYLPGGKTVPAAPPAAVPPVG